MPAHVILTAAAANMKRVAAALNAGKGLPADLPRAVGTAAALMAIDAGLIGVAAAA